MSEETPPPRECRSLPNTSNTSPCEVVAYDAHGFAVFRRDGPSPESERCHMYRKFNFTERHIQSWTKLLSYWEPRFTCKLESYLVKGMPAWLRPQLWKKLLDTDALRLSANFDYKEQLDAVREQLVDLGISEYGGDDAVNYLCDIERKSYRIKYGQVSVEALRHIMLDLDRSYPTHINYMGNSVEAREGRASLFRVLATYARYNRAVEYCQGMSSIAGMFLMYLGEEEAFWCLVSLLERYKYLLGYFNDAMERVQKHAKVLERLLMQRQPRLHQHLEEMGVNVLMYVTPWFMCLFTSLPSWDTVLAIWDLLLLEGHKCIFRVALAILDLMSCDLLQSTSMCQALPLLLHLPAEKVNYDNLMPVVWSIHVEDWEVSSLLAVLAEEEAASPSAGQKRTRRQAQRDSHVVEFHGRDQPQNKRQKMDAADAEAPSLFGKLIRMFKSGSAPPATGPQTTQATGGNRSARTPPARSVRLTPKSKRHSLTPRSSRRRPHVLSSSTDAGLRIRPTHKAGADSGVRSAQLRTCIRSTSSLRATPRSKMPELVLTPDLNMHNFSAPMFTMSSASGVCKPVFTQMNANGTHGNAVSRMSPRLPPPRPVPKAPLRDLNTTPCGLRNSLKTASSHHTFKSFHTPLPLRKTQVVPPFGGVCYSSPEIELKPLKRRKSGHMTRGQNHC